MHRSLCPLPRQPHALALAGALLLAALPAGAAVFTPTRFDDPAVGACNADCSLREAVVAANANPGADVIALGPGTYLLTIAGPGEDAAASGDLDVTGELVILGDGAASTVIDTRGADRLIDLHGAALELVGVTLAGGTVAGNGGLVRNLGGELTVARSLLTTGSAIDSFGGAIYSDGTLTVVESTVFGNDAGSGGGIAARNSLTLVNSTLSANAATALGGGLYVFADVDGVVANTTITGNRAQRAGGVYVESAAFLGGSPGFRNTIIARNHAPQDTDCAGSADSLGFNLLGVGGGCFDFTAAHADNVGTAAAPLDPRLTTLANHGGPTPTHAPLPASPAVDGGNPAAPGSGGDACEATDQRGADRPGKGSARCDIGAVELTDQCVAGGANLCLEQGRFQVSARWTTPQGQTGAAEAVQLTDDAGYFWFFSPENVELTVKVLNACIPAFNRYWVFLSGLTNLQVEVRVVDTKTGQTKTYTNPQGRTFRTILDTQAFSTCP
ncbi:MAG TPA: choice-of-anchor Q domain-containing protein [Thermoanaerobaculia bacterium]|nr:choice-of-anchor Q domain-containing protein [Thermoanaerobaculia bacterium]